MEKSVLLWTKHFIRDPSVAQWRYDSRVFQRWIKLVSCVVFSLELWRWQADLFYKVTKKWMSFPRGLRTNTPYIFYEAHLYCCKTRLFENAVKSAMSDNWAPNNKNNFARWLKDMNFMFWWHCFCHSNVKFVSSRQRLMSSIYFAYFDTFY